MYSILTSASVPTVTANTTAPQLPTALHAELASTVQSAAAALSAQVATSTRPLRRFMESLMPTVNADLRMGGYCDGLHFGSENDPIHLNFLPPPPPLLPSSSTFFI